MHLSPPTVDESTGPYRRCITVAVLGEFTPEFSEDSMISPAEMLKRELLTYTKSEYPQAQPERIITERMKDVERTRRFQRPEYDLQVWRGRLIFSLPI